MESSCPSKARRIDRSSDSGKLRSKAGAYLTDHKSLLAAEMNELRNDVAKLKTLKAGVSNQNADIASIKENV